MQKITDADVSFSCLIFGMIKNVQQIFECGTIRNILDHTISKIHSFYSPYDIINNFIISHKHRIININIRIIVSNFDPISF